MLESRRRFGRWWRLHGRPAWRAARPIVILVLALAVVVLGTIGFMRLGKDYRLTDSLYRALTLFGFGGAVDPHPPVTLEIARILAPLLTGYAAIGGILLLARDQVELLGIRLFARDHVVIAGLGDIGSRLARTLQESGHRVIAIERDMPANASVPGLLERGASVLPGDATDVAVLRRAQVQRARHLLVTCGDDGTGCDVAMAASDGLTDRRPTPLGAFVHVADLELWTTLSAEAVAMSRVAPVRLQFFNVFATAARLLIEEHPAFGERGDEPRTPHAVVVGLSGVGEQLILHLARDWRRSEPDHGEELTITIAGPGARDALRHLCQRHPELPSIVRLTERTADLDSAAFRGGEILLDEHGGCDVDVVYLCLPEESQSLTATLALHGRPAARSVPIVVALPEDDDGVARLIGTGEGRFAGAVPFGVLSRALSPALLLGGINEVLARLKHDEYVRHERAKDRPMRDSPAMVPWDELSEDLRESNRRFADGIGRKLAAAGCIVIPAPLDGDAAARFRFSDDEIEQLAVEEHERWKAERLHRGWRLTTGPTDYVRKLHPKLVPWSELDEIDRERDRSPVRDLPEILERAGFWIVRGDAARAAAAAPERDAVR